MAAQLPRTARIDMYECETREYAHQLNRECDIATYQANQSIQALGQRLEDFLAWLYDGTTFSNEEKVLRGRVVLERHDRILRMKKEILRLTLNTLQQEYLLACDILAQRYAIDLP
ncbi:hypothetical protein CTheo_8455 [Ceratobasidium theobromae]|uniref:Uncharacterized protein n=1 Tax=Ceratobasidium theobromae TaxID=1582974 RepID=A0A5N5Q8L9_9AGAM|nr:hypothetical protein CTheo_8455 [Ceratobasidium theobromae]